MEKKTYTFIYQKRNYTTVYTNSVPHIRIPKLIYGQRKADRVRLSSTALYFVEHICGVLHPAYLTLYKHQLYHKHAQCKQCTKQ